MAKKKWNLRDPQQIYTAVLQTMTIKALQGDARAAKVVLEAMAEKLEVAENPQPIIIDDIPTREANQ